MWHQWAPENPLTSHTAEANGSLMLPPESMDGVRWEKKGPVIKPNREDDGAYDRGGLGLTGIGEVDGEIWMPIIKASLGISTDVGWQQLLNREDSACPTEGLLLDRALKCFTNLQSPAAWASQAFMYMVHVWSEQGHQGESSGRSYTEQQLNLLPAGHCAVQTAYTEAARA